MKLLDATFFGRPTAVVARDLLGHVLVRRTAAGVRVVRVVETEAYVGTHDLACHAAKGHTARTAPMFGPPGRAYVYLVYGMHHCFNVVTEGEGSGTAVLVRGAEAVLGVPSGVRLDGPGRLCRALDIDRTHDGCDLLTEGALHLAEGEAVSDGVGVSARVGVGYAGAWAAAPLRFFVQASRGVSRPRGA